MISRDMIHHWVERWRRLVLGNTHRYLFFSLKSICNAIFFFVKKIENTFSKYVKPFFSFLAGYFSCDQVTSFPVGSVLESDWIEGKLIKHDTTLFRHFYCTQFLLLWCNYFPINSTGQVQIKQAVTRYQWMGHAYFFREGFKNRHFHHLNEWNYDTAYGL